MKAALISLGSKSSLMTLEEMKKYFDQVDNINIKEIDVNLSGKKLEVFYKGNALDDYDCIYAKGSFRYAPLLRSITDALSLKSYMPIRAEAFTSGHDKLITHLVLQNSKIPMPTTYIASTIDAARAILKKVNYPIIMKFPQGTQGKGVMFADSFASASSILDALAALKQSFIIQEYIETDGVDLRVVVAGDKVIACMRRKAELMEKRANIHIGGTGEACLLDEYTKKVAIDAAAAIGADICAIDMLETQRGPMVIEINLSPGLQGITQVTGINVAAKISKYLYEKTKDIKEKKGDKRTIDMMKKINAKEGIEQNILTQLDFRGDRILLPKFVTRITGFNDKEEYSLKIVDGKVIIEKS